MQQICVVLNAEFAVSHAAEELIKNGGDPTGNFGLDVFKKQMSGLQTPA